MENRKGNWSIQISLSNNGQLTKIPAFLPELPLWQAGAGMTKYYKKAPANNPGRRENRL